MLVYVLTVMGSSPCLLPTDPGLIIKALARKARDIFSGGKDRNLNYRLTHAVVRRTSEDHSIESNHSRFPKVVAS